MNLEQITKEDLESHDALAHRSSQNGIHVHNLKGENVMSRSMSDLLSEYVTDTIKRLVDNPEDVNIFITVSTKSVIVQIKSKKEDLGKIIGKKGRTIDALKIITLAIKNTHFPQDTRRVSLEIIEDENSSFMDLNRS